MSAIQLIALASTVSLLAGWRLYLVTFAVGLAMKLGWVALPAQLHTLDILANNWIIGIAAVGALAEFFADKIPWVDSAWDAIHSVVRPIGGHAVYIDARALLPHVPALAYPGQSLAVALYEAGGIRGCEIGTVMFGRHPDGTESAAPMDLVRLAIPRRTYTQSHVDYVIEVVRSVADRASELRGYRIVREPAALRHFTAAFAPLDG